MVEKKRREHTLHFANAEKKKSAREILQERNRPYFCPAGRANIASLIRHDVIKDLPVRTATAPAYISRIDGEKIGSKSSMRSGSRWDRQRSFKLGIDWCK